MLGRMASRTARFIPGFALALASLLLLSRTARADIVSPEISACSGKATGDACEDAGKAGTCQPDKCSKLDYSRGTPPSSVEYDCAKCVPAAAAPAVVTTPAATPTTAPTPGPEPTPKASGCAIAGDGGGPMVALLLLLAVGSRRSRRADVSRR